MHYCGDISLQRKFARGDGDVACDTFKKFRKWLDETYTLGSPTNEEWETIMQEDQQFIYDTTSSAEFTPYDNFYSNDNTDSPVPSE